MKMPLGSKQNMTLLNLFPNEHLADVSQEKLFICRQPLKYLFYVLTVVLQHPFCNPGVSVQSRLEVIICLFAVSNNTTQQSQSVCAPGDLVVESEMLWEAATTLNWVKRCHCPKNSKTFWY